MLFRNFLPFAFACIAQLAVAQTIPANPVDISPLLYGEQIPSVMLQSIEGKSVDLLKLVSEKPTVLIFYRGGWCPYCNAQLSGMQEAEADIKAAGYSIVAVSPDSPENLKASLAKNHLTYTLLSDSQTKAANAFGIAYKAPEKYGDLLFKSSGNQNKDTLPVPSVFVLDVNGQIIFEYINPDFKQRLDPALLMAVLTALKK